MKVNILIISILICTILIRLWFTFHNDRQVLIDKYSGQTVEIIGSIFDEPQVKDFSKAFTLKTEKINDNSIETYIQIQANRYSEYEYGQKLKIKGKLSQPFNFKSNGGRTFDYIDYLLKDGIYFVMKKPKIEVLENDNGNFISKYLFKM